MEWTKHVALLIVETTEKNEPQQIKSNSKFGFWWDGKTGVPWGATPPEWSREPNSTHVCRRGQSRTQTSEYWWKVKDNVHKTSAFFSSAGFFSETSRSSLQVEHLSSKVLSRMRHNRTWFYREQNFGVRSLFSLLAQILNHFVQTTTGLGCYEGHMFKSSS